MLVKLSDFSRTLKKHSYANELMGKQRENAWLGIRQAH